MRACHALAPHLRLCAGTHKRTQQHSCTQTCGTKHLVRVFAAGADEQVEHFRADAAVKGHALNATSTLHGDLLAGKLRLMKMMWIRAQTTSLTQLEAGGTQPASQNMFIPSHTSIMRPAATGRCSNSSGQHAHTRARTHACMRTHAREVCASTHLDEVVLFRLKVVHAHHAVFARCCG